MMNRWGLEGMQSFEQERLSEFVLPSESREARQTV